MSGSEGGIRSDFIMSKQQKFLNSLYNNLPGYSQFTQKIKEIGIVKLALKNQDQTPRDKNDFLKMYSIKVLISIGKGLQGKSFSIAQFQKFKNLLDDHRNFMKQVFIFKFSCPQKELNDLIINKMTCSEIYDSFCCWLEQFNPTWLIQYLYEVANDKIFPLNNIIFMEKFTDAQQLLQKFCKQNNPSLKREIIQNFFKILRDYQQTSFDMFHLVRLLVMREINRGARLLGSIQWLWLSKLQPRWHEDEILLRKAIHYEYFQRKELCQFYQKRQSVWIKFQSI